MKKVLIGLLIGVMLFPAGCTKKTAVKTGNETGKIFETTENSTEEITEPSTEAPTEAPTEPPTEAPTKAPVVKPTNAPTEAATEATVVKPTEGPTKAPVVKPTEAPTKAPVVKPTEAPTKAPVVKPTEAPTEAPVVKPTSAPTEAPTQAQESDAERYEKLIKSFTPTGLNSYTLKVGETHKPTASVWMGSGIGAKAYSNNENVVKIDEFGTVTAVGEGSAYVIIEANTSMYNIYLYTVISTSNSEISIPDGKYGNWIKNEFVPSGLNSFTLKVNSTHKPTAAVWLSSGNGEVYSSDTSVVTINQYGVVTAVGTGSAYVIIVSPLGDTMHEVYLYNVIG